jgi:hypothetical protein
MHTRPLTLLVAAALAQYRETMSSRAIGKSCGSSQGQPCRAAPYVDPAAYLVEATRRANREPRRCHPATRSRPGLTPTPITRGGHDPSSCPRFTKRAAANTCPYDWTLASTGLPMVPWALRCRFAPSTADGCVQRSRASACNVTSPNPGEAQELRSKAARSAARALLLSIWARGSNPREPRFARLPWRRRTVGPRSTNRLPLAAEKNAGWTNLSFRSFCLGMESLC